MQLGNLQCTVAIEKRAETLSILTTCVGCIAHKVARAHTAKESTTLILRTIQCDQIDGYVAYRI